jgi:hypothetical protein
VLAVIGVTLRGSRALNDKNIQPLFILIVSRPVLGANFCRYCPVILGFRPACSPCSMPTSFFLTSLFAITPAA